MNRSTGFRATRTTTSTALALFTSSSSSTTTTTLTTTTTMTMNTTTTEASISSLLLEIFNCSSHETCFADSDDFPTDTQEEAYCNLTAKYDIDDACCRKIGGSPNDANMLNTLMNVWLMGLFGMIGVFSNILATVVLSHPRLSSSTTSQYLRALALSDLTLCFVVTAFCLADFGNVLPMAVLNMYIRAIPIVSVLPHVSRLNSILLVIAVTVERYVAVCHPLKAQRFCTMRYCRIFIVVILIIAIAANLPRFAFIEFSICYGTESNLMSEFYLAPLTLIIYSVIFESAIYCVCPFAILTIFNILLLRSVRKSTAFIRSSNSAHERRSAETQRQLTVMLIVVVAAFSICQIPALIYSIIVRPIQANDPSTKANEVFLFIDTIRNCPVVLNSALNFWLYCAAGQKFREAFFHIFCLNRCCKPSSDTLTNTPSAAAIEPANSNHRSRNSSKQQNASQTTLRTTLLPSTRDSTGSEVKRKAINARNAVAVKHQTTATTQPPPPPPPPAPSSDDTLQPALKEGDVAEKQDITITKQEEEATKLI